MSLRFHYQARFHRSYSYECTLCENGRHEALIATTSGSRLYPDKGFLGCILQSDNILVLLFHKQIWYTGRNRRNFLAGGFFLSVRLQRTRIRKFETAFINPCEYSSGNQPTAMQSIKAVLPAPIESSCAPFTTIASNVQICFRPPRFVDLLQPD